jgi:CubicO group peptidase (beta-lactamase class C family)
MCEMDAIAKLVDDALAAGLGSAIAISVGNGGREVFRRAVGHTRRLPTMGEPIDAHTPFDLASVTKVIATAELARLAQVAGTLDVDTPLRAWLPECASEGRVRDALDHRAGFAAHVEIYRALRGGSPRDPYRVLVERAAREPCGPAPGPRAYSDLGFIVLGDIVSRSLGESLDIAYTRRVADPLAIAARYATTEAVAGAVSTELDDRGLVTGLPHDENAFYARAACGHAGVFASIDDVARFAAAVIASAEQRAWLGWDRPAREPGVSHAGDRWPRDHAYGHNGFTGTSLWLDVPRGRWVALLTNRVHPTRHAGTADAIKTLRRAVHDAVVDALA